jgi:glycerophosphodiester phosphodiesterase
MKFGANLTRNQVPEWSSSYIQYKALKKLIKAGQKAVEAGEEPDLAGFFFSLDRQLETVDTFYNRKYGEFSRRLRLLSERYGISVRMPDSMEKADVEELVEALLELRGMYRKLQWYGEVNRRGFVKILKKLNKKIESSTAQSRYLATRVDWRAFSTNNKLSLDMRQINKALSDLNNIKLEDDDSSIHSGSSGSLRHLGSKATLQVHPSLLEAIELAIKEHAPDKLRELLHTLPATLSEEAKKGLRLDYLQRAIAHRALDCIPVLLQEVDSIDQQDDMNQRNCIHRLVISIGRARVFELSQGKDGVARIPNSATYINAAEPPIKGPGSFKVEERDPTGAGKDLEAEGLLRFVLESLSVEQRTSVLTKDAYGRLPLHYAAQYGLVQVCLDLISYMEAWSLFDVGEGLDAPAWQDLEGFAP